MKIAFLLHHIYGIRDATHALLAPMADTARQYCATVVEQQRKSRAEEIAKKPSATPWSTVQDMIRVNRPFGPKKHSLPAELIVSLTSYPARFATLALTLESLLAQTIRANRMICGSPTLIVSHCLFKRGRWSGKASRSGIAMTFVRTRRSCRRSRRFPRPISRLRTTMLIIPRHGWKNWPHVRMRETTRSPPIESI